MSAEEREFTLASIAPRLARARDAWVREDLRARRAAARLEQERDRARRLVEHRDLQLLRAAGSHVKGKRKRRWVRERVRKLNAAEEQLRRLDGDGRS